MKRLIGRAAQARAVKERVPAATTGKKWLTGGWLALLCGVAATAFAQDTANRTAAPAPDAQPAATAAVAGPGDDHTELKTVVEPKVETDPTSLSPLGDDFSPTNGTITFSATDISIPGNFAIPVTLRRWVPSDDSDTGGPAGWKWNIPFIRGNFLDVRDGQPTSGWQWGNPNIWRNGKNCTGDADTVIDNASKEIAANVYWQGKLLHIPGVTSETFLTASSGEQVTKSHFKITQCINNPSDAQGIAQEGIVVKGPDGTTYTFNQIKTYFNNKRGVKDPIVRTRLLMITTIRDRFNNEVNYSYNTDGKLERISASDGREITISYQNGEVHQASAHGRTWTYGPGGVTLPDGRQWTYAGLSALAFNPNGIGGYSQTIQLSGIPPIVPGCTVAAVDYPVTVNSPDGLQTSYIFRDTVHYRSEVEPDISGDTGTSRALFCTVARSLVSKTSSGPGIGSYTWNYTYSGNRGTYTETSIPRRFLAGPFDLSAPVGGYPAPIAAGGGAVNYRSVTVSGPDKRTVFYIDRKFQSISEQRVVAQDTLNATGTQLLERSESSFALGTQVGMHWYMCPCEGLYPPINENQLTHHINQTQERRIRYVNNVADATFTTAYPALDFDDRGRPKTVIRSGSVGAPARTERMEYDLDNTTFGVMGQLKSVSVDGIIPPMVEHTYDSYTAQRKSTSKFGIPQASYEYHADGNLWKYIDGLMQATVYTDYHRGQPQRIDRANGTFETAIIDDWGLVSSRTDPNRYPWSYGYDNALRLAKITPPPGWTGTTITYERGAGADYGLDPGHWRQTVDKGNARTVTYFDVLWRPLMVRSYDVGNESTTRKVVVKTFDVGGQVLSESYPQRDIAAVTAASPGRRMQYDALGRNTRIEADSETGVLVTTTDYLSGFQTRVTNPRNKITTQSMWAQDDPDKAQLATITAPEGVNVAIARNLLGNPTSIRRWGTARGMSADVTRSYVYDDNQRLCKTLEPEVIATMQGYDAAGNVAWRAPGVNLSGNICDNEASVPAAKKIIYEYDLVNQLKKVTYGDNSPAVTRTYWDDGLLRTIDSNGTSWSYDYNTLRKPTTEVLTYGGKTYNFVWGYDTNGNLSALTYPAGGPSLSYSPNALGESSQVGSYATNIAYHPNGAVSGFTFGNNIVHSLAQTVEGTPKLNSDGSVLQDSYTYDLNGNVATITDERGNPSDGRFSRTMTYDDLDRLAGVSAPGVWGSAIYVYDPVDNLRTATVGTRASTLIYSATTKRLDSVVTNGASTGYDYDGNGNISQKGGQTYAFDLGNRLTSASMGGGYVYDGHGRRTRILSGDGSSRIQVYSQGGQLLWSESNALSTLATATYSCSSGSLVGQQCVSTSTYAAAVALRCNAGDSLGGTTCTHTSSYTSTTNYSCPSGGSLSGNTCSRNDNYAASVNYSCNAGDGLSGSTCLHTNYVQAEVNYSCPNGDTLHYMTCSTPVYTPAATSYNCNGLISDGAGLCNGEGTLSASYYEAWDVCQAKENVYGLSLNSVTLVSGRRYNCVFQANTAYACPNGGMLSGAQCISSSSYAATPNYSCGAGTLSGTQCAVPQNYAATVNYSCPGGDPLSGSTCLKTTVYTATPSYSCPSGGSLNGTSCTVTSAYAATPDYSCTGADILNGSTCTRTTTISATAAYSCPNGAAPSNGQCTGTNSTSTAYIYLGGKQIVETVVGGATQYVHTDALGSPVAHTSQTGAETSRTKFEPYGYTAGGTKPGPALAGMPTTGSAIGFTGHVNDTETDLVYMQQRYYDPIAGRFLSVDPVVTDANTGSSFNRYSYASNNPYLNVDPDGRTPLDAAFLVWDIAKLGGAVYSGVGIGPAMIDVAISTAGVFSPVPGAGQVYKAVRIGETVRAAEHAAEGAKAVVQTEAQAKNIQRFTSKLPANAKDSVVVTPLPNGGVAAQGVSPGRVPGSSALYEKQIDSAGKTVQYTKTTTAPDGKIVHVKDKITGDVITP